MSRHIGCHLHESSARGGGCLTDIWSSSSTWGRPSVTTWPSASTSSSGPADLRGRKTGHPQVRDVQLRRGAVRVLRGSSEPHEVRIEKSARRSWVAFRRRMRDLRRRPEDRSLLQRRRGGVGRTRRRRRPAPLSRQVVLSARSRPAVVSPRTRPRPRGHRLNRVAAVRARSVWCQPRSSSAATMSLTAARHACTETGALAQSCCARDTASVSASPGSVSTLTRPTS